MERQTLKALCLVEDSDDNAPYVHMNVVLDCEKSMHFFFFLSQRKKKLY